MAYQKNDRIQVTDGPFSGRTGIFKAYSTLGIPGRECRVIIEPKGRERTEKTVYLPLNQIAQIQNLMTSESITSTFKKGDKVAISGDFWGGNTGTVVTERVINNALKIEIEGAFVTDKQFPTIKKPQVAYIPVDRLKLFEEQSQDSATSMETSAPEYRLISLLDIIADPGQPRKHFDETALSELIASIREKGVLQPIVVRPVKNPEPFSKYMLVCGERRFRAAGPAGLAEIPAIIREMSDEEALELQITENLQRKDVHPMEEALAIRAMLEHGKSIEDICARLGRGKQYIAARLKLGDLTQKYQDAYLAGLLNDKEARIISTLTEEVQEELYKESAVLNENDLRGLPEKFRFWQLDYWIGKRQRQLDEATFDTEDPNLYPEMGACGQCPFNSSNTPQLFMEEGGRICNKPSCYAIKTQRTLDDAVEAAAALGHFLIGDFWESPYDNDERKEVKLIEEVTGLKVFGRQAYSVVEEPEPFQTYEEWLAGSGWDAKDMDEGDKVQSREEYVDYENEWKKGQQAWENTTDTRTGLYVIGRKKGRKVRILLNEKSDSVKEAIDPKTEEERANAQLEAQIAEINKREARAKELDNEKVYAQVAHQLKEHEAFLDNPAPLTHQESIALAIFLMNSNAYNAAKVFIAEVNAEEPKNVCISSFADIKRFEQLNQNMLPGTLNKFIRQVLVNCLITSELDFGKYSKAAAIMAIARHYMPDVVKEAELQQLEKAIKRQEKVETKIAELEAKKGGKS